MIFITKILGYCQPSRIFTRERGQLGMRPRPRPETVRPRTRPRSKIFFEAEAEAEARHVREQLSVYEHED